MSQGPLGRNFFEHSQGPKFPNEPNNVSHGA